MRCTSTVVGRSLAVAARAICERRRKRTIPAPPPPDDWPTPTTNPPSAADVEIVLLRYSTYAPHPERHRRKA